MLYDHGIPCITAILTILQSKALLLVRSLYAIVVYHIVDATHSFRIHVITYIVHRGFLFDKIISNKTMNFNDLFFSRNQLDSLKEFVQFVSLSR